MEPAAQRMKIGKTSAEPLFFLHATPARFPAFPPLCFARVRTTKSSRFGTLFFESHGGFDDSIRSCDEERRVHPDDGLGREATGQLGGSAAVLGGSGRLVQEERGLAGRGLIAGERRTRPRRVSAMA